MKVILIGGQAGSGKNTVADIMKKHLEAKGKQVVTLGNGDAVREYAKKYFNLEDYKTEEGRRIMIGITDMMYDLFPHYYDMKTLDRIKNSKDTDVAIIFDWRYECTYKYFEKNPFIDLHAVYVKRPMLGKEAFRNDKSEREEVLRPFIDYTFYNTSGLDVLATCVESYLNANLED